MPTQTRVVPRDVAALVAVPVVLVAVHLLPQSLRVDLMLNYGSPSVLTMYTTHFVHANWGHLAGNVGVYLVAVSLSYALFVYAGSKSQFFTGFAAVLLLAPLPLSAFDLYMLGSEAGDVYSRGFSGLAAAYVGFLPVAVFVFLGNELSDRLKPHESMGLFLLSLGVVLLTYSGPMEPATWLAFVTGGLYYVHPYRKLKPEERARFRNWNVWRRSLLLYASFFFLASPVVLFPSEPDAGGSFVNVVTHFIGFATGYFLALASGCLQPAISS